MKNQAQIFVIVANSVLNTLLDDLVISDNENGSDEEEQSSTCHISALLTSSGLSKYIRDVHARQEGYVMKLRSPTYCKIKLS